DTILFTGGNYICRGAAIGLNSGINVADGTVSLNLPITCLFDQTWQNLSAVGSLTLSTNMDLGGHALTLDADVGLFVGINAPGVINGAGHLIKDGPVQMHMTGTNAYTGPTPFAEVELILDL